MKATLRVAAAFSAVAIFVAGAHFLRISGSGAPDFPDRTITAQSPEALVEIPEGATGSAIASILEEKKIRYDFESLDEMTSSQLCIYLEFLLRAFNKLNVNGKKWSLNLVDSARAKGPVRGRDGRISIKELFIVQEK